MDFGRALLLFLCLAFFFFYILFVFRKIEPRHELCQISINIIEGRLIAGRPAGDELG
jgi:hypothetical protein